MARTKRQKKIEELLETTENSALNAVSQLTTATNYLRKTLPFMHNSILKGDGDLEAENRSDFSSTLDPAFGELIQQITYLQELNAIFSEDPSNYQSNLDAYLLKYPEALEGAENLVG